MSDNVPAVETCEKVRDLIRAFLALYPKTEYGWAHIVLSDYNLADHWIDSCIAHSHDDVLERHEYDGVLIPFLRFLQAIPEVDRIASEDEV